MAEDTYFSPRYDQAEQLSKDFGFNTMFEKVRLNNFSNTLPYHNWFHTCCMVCNCIEGAQYYNLDFRQCYLIGVSALFHDFNHSGGRSTDAENIEVAVKGFQDFGYGTVELDNLQIEHTIRVTQYPFIHTPKTIEQKIIRDADLMQVLEPEWFEHIILGLQLEFLNGGKSFTEQEMLKGQMVFLSEHIPHNLFTEWAKSKFATNEYAWRQSEILSRIK
jgi:hypothetical protein